MEKTTEVGLNRTGIDMSPIDSQALIEITSSTPPDVSSATNPTLECVRAEIVNEVAEGIGSVPPPASIVGVANTLIEKLSGKNVEILIDKLAERAAFERTGTRLYDALIAKVIGLSTIPLEILTVLQSFREAEVNHYNLIVKTMKEIGADPTAQTPCADMIAVTSIGVIQTISDPRSTFSQSLNALLTAELTDNAGWELLIDLTRKFGDDNVAQNFQKALDEENLHLVTIKTWLKDSVLNQA